MSIFIDTGIFIGYVNKDDVYHTAASGLVEDIMYSKYGTAFTSNAVFDEKLCHSQPFLKVSDLKL